jgi:thiopeptide-type bacteriocin biosynthesis protein
VNGTLAFADDAIVVGRVPMLPANVVRDVYAAADPEAALRALIDASPLLEAGVRFASPSLYAELTHWLAGRREKKTKRVVLSLLAYALRMASRCTPYGLFASIGCVELGDVTSLALAPAAGRQLHLEPDFAWLNGVLGARRRAPQMLDDSMLFASDLIVDRGEGYYVYRSDRAQRVFDEAIPVWRYDGVCVRANATLRAIRERCARGASGRELAAMIAQRFNADVAAARGLIGKLLDAGLLVTQRLPLLAGDLAAHTGRSDDPGWVALAGLSDWPALAALAADMTHVEAAGLSVLTPADAARLEGRMAGLAPARQPVLDVDVTHRFAGTLDAAVLDDVALLAKISLANAPRTDMLLELERFVESYESVDRLVPLLELVQSDFAVAIQPRGTASDARRDRLLLELATAAVRDGRREIELTAPLLDELYPGVRERALSHSCEIGFRVTAGGVADIARGEYRIVATKIASSNGVAKSARRFARHLDAPFVDRVIAAERRTSAEGDDLVAELDYVPLDEQYAHLLRRTTGHRYVIADAATPTAPCTTKISPADILIGIEAGRFVAYARSLGKRVRIEDSFLLDADYFAPPHMRLLSRLAHQDRATPTAWSWGAAAELLPFWPRVKVGRIVLAPATWSIPKCDLSGTLDALAATIAGWRTRWHLPRWVLLTERDMQLPLDLDAPIALELLHDQVRRYGGEIVQFEELLPAFDELWLDGEDGAYAHEFVATLVATPAAPLPPARTVVDLDLDGLSASASSPWAYVKLYVAASEIDALIATGLARIVQPILERGAADSWFFLRYRDPQPHVRLRLRSTSGCGWHLVMSLVAAIQPLMSAGLVRRFSFDTYLPEIERYGGVGGLAAAEALFHADSEAVIRELGGAVASRPARHAAALRSLVRTLPQWFRVLDLATWLAQHAQASRRVRGIDYVLVRSIRAWFTGCDQQASTTEREAIARLAHAAESGELSQPLTSIFEAIMHMHFNRFGISFDDEAFLIAHLWRALFRGAPIEVASAEVRVSDVLVGG